MLQAFLQQRVNFVTNDCTGNFFYVKKLQNFLPPLFQLTLVAIASQYPWGNHQIKIEPMANQNHDTNDF